ncbi:MAG: aminoglycoside phosphotransferase family protein [Gammaproteobacteria bacterium]|nr:aminoglycoside phosphotransferase family protein [Gammaproteobacteria bacterium]
MKHTPELIALEASIIHIMRDQFHFSVPTVIAHNAELNCFLLFYAGRPLREILKKEFDTTLFCKAIDQFTAMQLAVADHVNVFLDIGVPDWRLDKLPDLYMQLLSQKEMLMSDGLTEKEIEELKNLFPTVSNLCKKLSGYAIKQSIVQPDFNDNNTLIADGSQKITMIDLGEIAISHPFFSLINCLLQAKKHHGLTDNDETYLQLMDACLKNYMDFESKENLLDAFNIAKIVWFVYGALATERLMAACNKSKFISSFQRHGRPSIPLRELMTAVSAIKLD